MFHYRSSRGAIVAWRQSGDAFVPATLKPRRRYDIRTRGSLARVASNFSTEGTSGTITPSVGSSTIGFAGTSIASGSMGTAAGTSTAAFAGMATVIATAVPAVGSSVVSFTGSAIAAGSFTSTGSSTVVFGSGSEGTMVPAAGSSAVSFTGTSIAAGDMTPAVGSSTVAMTGSTSGGGGSVDPAAVWNFALSNGKTAQETLVEVHAMLVDLYKVHGLLAGVPLIVDQVSRIAGDIEQSITDSGGATTVTRTA